MSSEFRGTVTLGRNASSGLPTLDTHFFECVERNLWDRGKYEFLTLEHLRKGVDYYVVVTTPSRFYRYFMNQNPAAYLCHWIHSFQNQPLNDENHGSPNGHALADTRTPTVIPIFL